MRGETILIVDDEKLLRWSLRQQLAKMGFGILEAETLEQGMALWADRDPDLMILDQRLPDGTGIDLLGRIKNGKDILPVIMLTAIDKSDIAVQAMKLGAFDYVTKPVNFEELKLVIEKALESTRLRRQIDHLLRDQQKNYGFCGLIGNTPLMQSVFQTIATIAQSSSTTVLIVGESGTGKELAAQAVHALSARHDKPLITVNCSALSESLIESELFGHEKGAFTDAKSLKRGMFELADGGTIFLDEIGEASPTIQVKLLRVLEQKTFQRVGGTADITVDVRIITATNQPLEQRVAEDTFRADLYYRLNVATIEMPPMRARGEDVILLAEYFLHEFNQKFHKHFRGFSEESRKLFLDYTWPGNVREIRNAIERAVLLKDGEYIEPAHFEFSAPRTDLASVAQTEHQLVGESLSLHELERQALLAALEKSDFNQTRAAKLLKISRDTLRYRMKKFDLAAR